MEKKEITKTAVIFFAAVLQLFAVTGCALFSGGGTDNDDSTTSTSGDTTSDSSYTAPDFDGYYYPASGSTRAYADTILAIKFDTVPVINTTDTSKTVKIYTSGGTLVDTIQASDETYYSGSGSGTVSALSVKNQLIQVFGTTVVIKPHTDSNGYPLLSNATKYYVIIDDGLLSGTVGSAVFSGLTTSDAWSFTTSDAPSVSNNTITVSTTDSAADFYSIQGALNYLRVNTATGDWTINVDTGSYLERLYYYGDANVTLYGPSGNSYGDTASVTWTNLDLWNSGSRARCAFLWEGGNLTIKNMSFHNDCDRSLVGTSQTQAETLYFDAKNYLIAYNSSFVSHQDTLLLGNNGGRCWFYDCCIKGDTDYIWGYADVALFEKCSLTCVRDTAISGQKSYIFASRTVTGDAVNKGFVLLNSSVEIENGVTAYYGRNSGADTQASVVNCNFTGAGTLADSLWYSAAGEYAADLAGTAAIGYKDYNNTVNGTAVDTSGRLTGTYSLTDAVYNREYNGRKTILNRGYSETDSRYETSSAIWDISSYETEFGTVTDNSLSDVWVDPIYVENLVGGKTKTLTATSFNSDVTYTWSSDNESYATVDSTGVVTAITGVNGTAVITATSSDGGSAYATVKVISTDVAATAVSLSNFTDTSMEVDDVTWITASFTPDNTTDKTVTWTSSNADILTVTSDTAADSTGATAVIYAAGTGTATITAAAANYSSATTATVTISVGENGKAVGSVPAAGYTFNFIGKDTASSDTLLSGAKTSATNITHNYNVGSTETSGGTGLGGKYITLLKSTKQVTLRDEPSSTYSRLQMKNYNITSSAWTVTGGSDALLLHNVTGPFTVTVGAGKPGSQRYLAIKCGDDSPVINDIYTNAGSGVNEYTASYSGTDTVDVLFGASNDCDFYYVTLSQ